MRIECFTILVFICKSDAILESSRRDTWEFKAKWFKYLLILPLLHKIKTTCRFFCVYTVLTRGSEKRERIVPVLQSGATWPLVHHFAVQRRTNSSPSADTAVWEETPLVCRTWSVSWRWRQGSRHDSVQWLLDFLNVSCIDRVFVYFH